MFVFFDDELQQAAIVVRGKCSGMKLADFFFRLAASASMASAK